MKSGLGLFWIQF